MNQKENMTAHSVSLSLQDAKRIIGLINNAYHDYIAARTLYLSQNLLPQATIFANTAIEKFLKAYLEATGLKIKIPHDTFKIFQVAKQQGLKVTNRLNPEYLSQLTKIYRARYYENIEPGYNYVILRKKYLAELDYTFGELTPLLSFSSRDGLGNLMYQIDRDNNNPALVEENYLLTNIPKNQYIESVESVHEFRMLPSHAVLEVKYMTFSSKNDGIFKFEALKPNGTFEQFTASHIMEGDG